ncbi:MAG: permease [Halobacteriales archaeon SW_9_67_25]|nr:MAG: permease [Halobacteriales archaeon SW_9_67_25]
MATSPATDDPGKEESAAEGPLTALYRRYVGEPDSQRDIYVGFGAFFGGIALGLVGLALFVYSGLQPSGSDVFWQLREVALVFTMLALPAVGVSVTVLLPVGRRTMAASLLGAAVCLAGTAWLTQVYPYQWTSAGNDVSVLSTYAVGVVLLAAATGSSLVAQYVDSVAPQRTGTATAGGEGGGGRDDSDAGETVSDEQVQADINEAVSDSSLTWGGVEQKSNTKRLEIDMPETPDIERSSVETATETRSASDDVDDAVSGLRQLQGGEQETARTESPDDQVAALTEFRQQREDEEIETGVDADEGVIESLREKLFE